MTNSSSWSGLLTSICHCSLVIRRNRWCEWKRTTIMRPWGELSSTEFFTSLCGFGFCRSSRFGGAHGVADATVQDSHMAKRVLVLSASVGAGHLRAAQAVESALRELDPGAAVKSMDVLDLTNAAFRRLYGKAYLDLVNKVPHVLGYFYDLLDRPRRPKSTRDRLRLAIEKLNLRPFLRFLEEKPWDVIVNTHFLPAEIIASLRRKDRFHTPQ